MAPGQAQRTRKYKKKMHHSTASCVTEGRGHFCSCGSGYAHGGGRLHIKYYNSRFCYTIAIMFIG